MEQDFIIIQVGWFTRYVTPDSLATAAQIHARHRVLLEFLQQHRLTTRTVLAPGVPLTDESCLLRSDLTEEGFRVYRQTEQRWLRSIDRTKRYTDMHLFEKELAKGRATSSSTKPAPSGVG